MFLNRPLAKSRGLQLFHMRKTLARTLKRTHIATIIPNACAVGSAVVTATAQANWNTGIDKILEAIQTTYLVNFKVRSAASPLVTLKPCAFLSRIAPGAGFSSWPRVPLHFREAWRQPSHTNVLVLVHRSVQFRS